MGAILVEIITLTKTEKEKGIQEKIILPQAQENHELQTVWKPHTHLTVICLFLSTGYKDGRPNTQKKAKPTPEMLEGVERWSLDIRYQG